MKILETIRFRLAYLRKSRWAQLAQATWNNYQRTNGVQMAAGIALFAMLSLLPLIMLLVSAVSPVMQPIFPGYDMRQGILHFAQITVSPVARLWLQNVLQSLDRNSVVVDGFTLIAFAWAASNVFSQLDSSFQRIWQEGEANSTSNLRLMVLEQFRRRRNGFLLLLLGLISFIATSLIGRWTIEWRPALGGRSSIVQTLVTSLVAWLEGGFFLTLLYRWLLPERTRWRGILVGALVASAANLLVRELVTSFVDSTIGATTANIGGPLALMLGVYLFVQNILIGCALVRQYIRVYA